MDEQGNAVAQYSLGVMYANGQGVAKNNAEAVQWYRKAAEQNDEAGIAGLGWCTATGRGMEKNLDEGERLLKLAASKGSDRAKERLKWVRATQACLKKIQHADFWRGIELHFEVCITPNFESGRSQSNARR